MDGNEVRGILGKNLKLFRGQKAMSQADLAETAGISIPFLSDIERGNKWPYMETLISLAGALNVAPFELLRPQTAPTDEGRALVTKCLDDVFDASLQSFQEALTKSLATNRQAYASPA